MQYKPHPYQAKGIQHVKDNTHAGLFLGLGLGKTSITLTVLEEWINSFQILRPLIVAPKLVTEQTWKAEIAKWDHTQGLTLSRIIGNEKQRISAFHAEADIYAVSRDNVAWLVKYMLKTKVKKSRMFDCLVIDELSSFKNRASQRFKALHKLAPHMQRVIGLTATPASNGLIDLWAQIFLLDQGFRLGRTLTSYHQQYFDPSHNGFGWDLREGMAPVIHDKIKDICMSMTAKDHLDIPPRMDVMNVTDTPKGYDEFKKKEFLKLDSGEEITPLSAGALYNKLAQYCNGFVYGDNKEVHRLNDDKLSSLLEAYEALNGEPVIIFYMFQADRDLLLESIPDSRPIKTEKDINAWNRGAIKCAVTHPASIGHGINLQEGGRHIFWFGIPWSLELYLQAIGRLERQGQKETVVNMLFITRGTVEEKIALRLKEKDTNQNILIDALKAEF